MASCNMASKKCNVNNNKTQTKTITEKEFASEILFLRRIWLLNSIAEREKLLPCLSKVFKISNALSRCGMKRSFPAFTFLTDSRRPLNPFLLRQVL